MKLSIATLNQTGAFSAKPVEREITWNGQTMKTYVRHLSYQTAVGDINSANGADWVASRIAASICDELGNPVFTVADITGQVQLPAGWKDGDPVPEGHGGLHPELTNQLLIMIGEVQQLGKKPKS